MDELIFNALGKTVRRHCVFHIIRCRLEVVGSALASLADLEDVFVEEPGHGTADNWAHPVYLQRKHILINLQYFPGLSY